MHILIFLKSSCWPEIDTQGSRRYSWCVDPIGRVKWSEWIGIYYHFFSVIHVCVCCRNISHTHYLSSLRSVGSSSSSSSSSSSGLPRNWNWYTCFFQQLAHSTKNGVQIAGLLDNSQVSYYVCFGDLIVAVESAFGQMWSVSIVAGEYLRRETHEDWGNLSKYVFIGFSIVVVPVAVLTTLPLWRINETPPPYQQAAPPTLRWSIRSRNRTRSVNPNNSCSKVLLLSWDVTKRRPVVVRIHKLPPPPPLPNIPPPWTTSPP